MATPKILAFAGSVRKASFNKQLVRIAAQAAEQAGGQVTLVDLKDYPLPLFDQDLEQDEGTPAMATALKQLFLDHHGLLIASPEYNSSISPLLKNTIDWVSRPVEGEPPLAAFTGKVASLMAASPGGLGGLRGLVHVCSILGNIGVTVLPNQVAIAKAYKAFDADGALQNEGQQAKVEALGSGLVATLAKLHA